MRILMVSAQKPDSTGSGVYLAETTHACMRQGHDVAVVAGIGPEDTPLLAQNVAFYPVRFETKQLPYPVVGMSDEMPYKATRYCDMDAEMVRAFRAAFGEVILRAIEEHDPEVVICHHLYLLTALVRTLAPDRVVTAVCHSTDLRQMRKHALEREHISSSVRRLDAVFALHEAQREEIIALYGVAEEAVHVIGTGFNAAVFGVEPSSGKDKVTDDVDDAASTESRTAADSDDALSGGAPVRLVYAGKIWEKKGVPALIRALDRVSECHAPLSLRLAGGHASDDEYSAIVALGSASKHSIEFLGKLPQEALAEEYRAASVFVLPSFFEGLPLVVIEALACGCKVVVTDLPGIRPWIDAVLPDAPVVYVEPPEMLNADEPVAGSLPAFEQRLAEALERCIAMSAVLPDGLEALSWDGLVCRLLSLFAREREHESGHALVERPAMGVCGEGCSVGTRGRSV